MTYEEAIAFWFDRINYEVKSAHPSDLKLERMRAFLNCLGNPQDRLRIVHITGTKGKGSTAAMLAAVARAAGYRVGLFTSPHLVRVEERMQVDGASITAVELAALITEMAPIVLKFEREVGLTFFELGTALGFLHFLRRRVDLALVEVGLGGRFDSTNVSRPLVSVITSIGFDHLAQLGRTLDEIAFQKGGIIKPGVPVVSGVMEDGPAQVLQRIADERRAPLVRLGTDFQYAYRPPRTLLLETRRQNYAPLTLGLLGEHQARNAAVAVATVECLQQQGIPIPISALEVGLRTAQWPARIEVIRENPTIVLDSAHNLPSALALVQTLREWDLSGGRKICIFSVSSDKQYVEILKVIEPYFDEFLFTRYRSNPRAVPPEKLVGLVCKPSTVVESPREAWDRARSSVKPEDLLCITGSVFLAGELQAAVRD